MSKIFLSKFNNIVKLNSLKNMSESKSYTFDEIHRNRIRIKSIKDRKFIEVYDFCKNFGEIMFIDVLVCKRPLVYVSFVHRKDAFAAMIKINDVTSMVAAFSRENPREYSNQLFVLDLSKLDEFEQIRLMHDDKEIRKQAIEEYTNNNNMGLGVNIRQLEENDPELNNHRLLAIKKSNKKRRHNRGIAFKNFDWASCLPNTNETNSVTCDWSDWDFDTDIQEIKNEQDDKTKNEENISDSDEECKNMSLTSWSVFNGEPKDWSKFRMPEPKSMEEYFPSLKNIKKS